MATLGSLFPKETVQASVARGIAPGAVIRFETRMDDGKAHRKRFVVLHCDENTLVVVINSAINPILLKPGLIECQVALPHEHHDFMKWDSHIDCSRLRIFSTPKLIELIAGADDGWSLGTITRAVADQIVAALKRAETIAPKLVEVCCASLEKVSLR